MTLKFGAPKQAMNRKYLNREKIQPKLHCFLLCSAYKTYRSKTFFSVFLKTYGKYI